jgi:hypothetical protein
MMTLSVLLIVVATGCAAMVVVHAFRRSLGTGVMVLLIPPYHFVYGFSQFEHRYKGPILAGWMGGLVLGVVLRALALSLAVTG